MAKRRGNPLKTRDKLLIGGGGLLALGTIVFFATRPKSTTSGGTSTTKSAPQNGAQPGSTVSVTPNPSTAPSPGPAPQPSGALISPTSFASIMAMNNPNVSWVPKDRPCPPGYEKLDSGDCVKSQ